MTLRSALPLRAALIVALLGASTVTGALGCRSKGDSASGGAEGEGASGNEQPAQQVACGKATCAAGEVCCNPSCGLCAPPDGMCTQQFCDDAPDAQAGDAPRAHDALTACDEVRCEAGTHCELVQVQCIRAPCDPVPECKDDDQGKKKD